jgi:ABC-type glutathione transport system ATPase component
VLDQSVQSFLPHLILQRGCGIISPPNLHYKSVRPASYIVTAEGQFWKSSDIDILESLDPQALTHTTTVLDVIPIMDLHLENVAPVHISIRELTVRVKDVTSTFKSLKRRFQKSPQDPEKVEQLLQEITHRISANVPAGSLTAITGVSGSGKTTLLNKISHRVSTQKLEYLAQQSSTDVPILGAFVVSI